MRAQLAPLVERELELETLERLLAGASASSGGAVVFEGPAGIGKSSLLAAARTAAAPELRVLSARGGELERELPFGIVRQLLEPVVVACDAEDLEALLAGAAALAMPVLFAADPGAGAEPSFSALHGLYWLTINLADAQPLLVAVDDAHWADIASLRWLIYLARRLEGVPLALVLATRPAEPGPVQDLLDELLVIPEVTVLQPGGLSEQAITMLAVQLLAAEPDPSFVTACRRATGGNPFLLLELLRELDRRGIAPSRENAGLASQLSSHGVGRAVRARLRRLPPECTALARAVAVLGDPAEPTIAAQLAGLDGDAASYAADALAEAVIFEPDRQLAFVHPLVRSNVYSELSSQERARHHERVARLLTDAGAATDRIAVHLLASHPRGDAETVTTLRQAAKGASNRGAPEVAATYLQRALAEPPSPELEPVLVHELGRAALSAGQLGMAIEKLRQATRDLADGRLRAEAADALGSALFLAHRPEEAMTDLTSVINELPEGEGEREQGLRLQATRWVAVRGSVAVWRRLQATEERFVVTSRRPRTIGERLYVAVAAYDAARTGTARKARELALQAFADGRLLEDPGPESGGFWIVPTVLLLAHADDDGARVSTAVIEWAKQHGSLPAFSMAAQLRAYISVRRGALAEAEADARGALEHPGVSGFPPYGREAIANVLLAQGKPTEAAEVFAQAASEPAAAGHIRFLQTRARLRAASQHPDEALEDLIACGRLEREWEIGTPAFSTWRADAAPLLASTGRHDEARALAREELERCRAYGAPAPLGTSLRALGLIEPGVAGIELLEQAVAHLQRSPARLEHALALLELGAATRRAGRRADAREPLREALQQARASGADAIAVRANDELVAAGARPRRDPTESRSNLTASELRVARMAAEAMTNREIAQALFLTENTIETHLRSVFRKLEIRSRSQLARAL
jgi:DNA-binding CsgD family transcriptional regulator/predicted negative regulator of RcsB-dependent stress response